MKDKKKEIIHEYTSEIVCPFCGCEFVDSWEYERGCEDIGLLECDNCYKAFYATRNVQVDYSTQKAKYGTCKQCKDEDVVIENYTSIDGSYKDLCQKCGYTERKRIRRAYFEKYENQIKIATHNK